MRQCEQLERDKRELLRQVVELGERGKVRAGAPVLASLAERPDFPLR